MNKIPYSDKKSFSIQHHEKVRLLVFLRVRVKLVSLVGVMFPLCLICIMVQIYSKSLFLSLTLLLKL